MSKLIKISTTSAYFAVDLTEEQLAQYNSGEEGATIIKNSLDATIMEGWWKNHEPKVAYYIEDNRD
jgi:hypothetical protein